MSWEDLFFSVGDSHNTISTQKMLFSCIYMHNHSDWPQSAFKMQVSYTLKATERLLCRRRYNTETAAVAIY